METTLEQPQGKVELQQWVKLIVQFGLAAYFSYNILSGNLANYVNERFAWLSYVAAVLFILLGASTYFQLRYSPRAPQHQTVGWGVIAIVAFPLLLGTLIPSRPLGVDAINGSINLTGVNVGAIAIVAKDPLQRNVLDWLRVFAQADLPASFDGQEAKVIGFVYREPDFPENHFIVARFTVSCCVADALPIGLPVYWTDQTTLPEGGWVEIRGQFEAGLFRTDKTPILQAQTVAQIEQPEHPYLYP